MSTKQQQTRNNNKNKKFRPSQRKRKDGGNKLTKSSKKPKLATLDVDEFMDKGFDNLSEEEESGNDESVVEPTAEAESTNDESVEPTSEAESGGFNDEAKQHKQSLKKLKDTDPEFYKFLEENDKDLLNFDVSSSDSEDDDKLHTVPDKLEVASDDSDYEGDETSKHRKPGLTLQQIKKWQEELQEPKPVEAIFQVCHAFKKVVEQLVGDSHDNGQGSTVFNAIMRLCIVDLVPAINRLLRAPKEKPEGSNFNPASAKMWPKLQPSVKLYIVQLLKVLPAVASPAIIIVLLKHVLQLVPHIAAFSKYAKVYLKRLIDFWSKGEESTRVIALLCIVRLARKLPDDLLELTFKAMYLAYVRNCKFTSPTTWPMINFMKHSLVEVLALNQVMAYQHAFVYIRQMAIHLRNAIMIKKKDSIKTVYNWQYIHCLYFWSHFLGVLHPSAILQPLIHPLTQIITGVIRLVPSAKYIPLRFHCVRALTTLARDTGTFIPTIPFLLEAFEIVNFGKKHSRTSWKPLDFTCALKLSKSQLEENSFKDTVVDQFYELLMDYLSVVSHYVGFPELVLTTTIQIRGFLKQVRVSRYNKQIKQLLEKINENSEFVSERRKSVAFSISDTKAVENWENQLKTNGTPILRYYKLYRNLRDKEIAMAMSQKEQLDDYDLPKINRKEIIAKKKAEDKKEFTGLFAGSSDSESDVEFTIKDSADESTSVAQSKQKKIKENVASTPSESSRPVIKETKKTSPDDKKLTRNMIRKKVKQLGLPEDIVEDINLSSSEDETENDAEPEIEVDNDSETEDEMDGSTEPEDDDSTDMSF